MEEIIDRNLTDFDIKTCINKLRDLRIERLIINRQLNDLIDEYNILNIQQDLETNVVNANTITEDQANKIKAIIMNRTKKI
ncbi:hypothetical protein LGK95_21615 [Clostridium algoriphilum]|uniref:hypothetical protein n=1 Tax=Clostridium algoriphilum TaxID=198347 RepID=UPI001CF4AA81|nr:hypothetical protein [Clostridium algoriphilum]MCB2296051.1 hypothetical protein [Clostridium algoriphilum]